MLFNRHLILALIFIINFDLLPAVDFALEKPLFINEIQAKRSLAPEEQLAFKNLSTTLLTHTDEHHAHTQIIKSVDTSNRVVTLEDDSEWKIGYWYGNEIKDWRPSQRLHLIYYGGLSNDIKLENIDTSNVAWGVVQAFPHPEKSIRIKRVPKNPFDPDSGSTVVLSNGLTLMGPEKAVSNYGWKAKDRILFLRNSSNFEHFDLWHLDSNVLIKDWQVPTTKPFDVTELKDRLAKRVLSQPEAIQTISVAVLNYCAGLKNPQTPLGVFLFLGPTGVGKTELAKALTDVLYRDRSHMIRFDMSHFVEPHAIARLIGSPPGYVNHEEGGQLTEAIKSKPRSVVLLDEIEKAHPSVHKFFLPVFDEGYITDNKDNKIPCQEVAFIMTSNICSQEIATLFQAGYDADAVLTEVEPFIIQILSPELYNRVQPVVFHPLTPETMKPLVELMLKEVIQRLKATKDINLVITDSVKKYLEMNGFHPTLGARPLKRLIEKQVVANISYALISEDIPNGSTIVLTHSEADDSWSVMWY